ncbi:MAG: DUF1800 domain-containing protein [Planctomycetales bacterium]
MGTPLAGWDPAEAWQPAPAEPWDLKWAAHLHRRAAFGFPAQPVGVGGKSQKPHERLKQAAAEGRDASVERLLAGHAGLSEFDDLMDALGGRISKTTAPYYFGGPPVEKLQGWWLYRMFHTPHPLRERLTLFWHDHFATSIAKVASMPAMLAQNRLLRRHALGRFGPLLHDVSHDPAMIVWLDTNKNVKGRPNENYARELMELFSLGVGNYSERDIREAARAFTGWGAAGGEFLFNDALHDDGEKTVLGRTGEWAGDDVVRIVLEQPACPRFLARKLFREFVSEAGPLPDALVEPLARRLRETDFDLADCLGIILRSRIFFSDDAYRARIKGPVEYVVGALQSFNARVPVEGLATAMEGLGQALFAPPNVKGWDGGEAWINSATLVARHNLAERLVGGRDDVFQSKIDPAAMTIDETGTDAEKQVDFLLNLLLQGDVAPEVRKRLTEHAEGGKPPESLRTPAEAANYALRLRSVTHAIMLLPEYQLA